MALIRVLCVAGARPNFMKVAPIVRQLGRRSDRFSTTLVHTGQHYDESMSRVFFEQLGMPEPDVNLNVGSGSHAAQTAAIMAAFEPAFLQAKPDVVVVVGDVNSTIACALVSVKLGVPVAHVEAGLRSFDRKMPEEINRVLTDQISEFLFTTEASAEENLRREGVAPEKIHFVGNVMIDTLLAHRDRARSLGIREQYGLQGPFGVVTLHRPTNVDTEGAFNRVMSALAAIADDLPLVFPVHPRTRPAIVQEPIAKQLVDRGRLTLLDPLGYLEFLALMQESALVVTDSGGIQEETTILGVPCLTLRENTERPITVTSGTNTVAGTTPDRILAAYRALEANPKTGRTPPLWDGHAADRVVSILDTSMP